MPQQNDADDYAGLPADYTVPSKIIRALCAKLPEDVTDAEIECALRLAAVPGYCATLTSGRKDAGK